MRSSELDLILAQIFHELAQDRQAIVNAVLNVIRAVPQEHDYRQDAERVEADISAVCVKKDRLLEMSIEGALSAAEFKQRNDAFNHQLRELELQREAVKMEEEKSRISVEQLQKIQAALEEELSFRNGVSSALVATILDRIVVKKNSTREEIYMDIYLKFGVPCVVRIDREKDSFCFLPSKNTIPAPAIRMISFQSVPLASSRLSIPSIREKTSSFRLMQPDVSKMKS